MIACREKAAPLFQEVDSTESGVDFQNNTPETKNILNPLDYLYYYNGAGVASGDFNNDNLADLFFVSNHGPNKLYLNQGNFRFRDVTDSAGVAGFAQWKTGVTLADVNGDGLLDIYVCALSNYKGIEGSNELFINMGNNTFQEKAADYGLDFSGMATQAVFFDYDHDGDLDMYLATHAPNNSRAYDRVTAEIETHVSSSDRFYRNDKGWFVDATEQIGISLTTLGHSLGVAVADLNNDGWEDIYVTNDFYEGDRCYINQKNGTFRDEAANLFSYNSRYARGCDVADLDNDGYPDVMTVDIADPNSVKSTHGEDPWETFLHKRSYNYPLQFSRNSLQKNQAGETFSEVAAFAGVAVTNWSWSVLMADFNNDGKKDIFTTAGIPKKLNDQDYLEFAHKDSLRYSETLNPAQVKRVLETLPDGKAANRMFENEGSLRFADHSQQWGIDKPGYSNGAIYADLDNDGDLDIVTNNFYGTASLFKNQTREQFPDRHFISVSLVADELNTKALGAKVVIKTKDEFQVQHATPTHGFLSSMQGPLHFGLNEHASIDSLIVLWNDGKTQVLTSVKADQQITIDKRNANSSTVAISLFEKQKPLLIETPLSFDFKHKENAYYDFYREPLIPFLTSREGPALAVGDVNNDGLEDFFVGGAKHQAGSLYLQQKDGSFKPAAQKSFEQDAVYEDVDAVFADVDGDSDLDLYVVSGGNEFYDAMPEQADRLYINDGKGNFTRDMDALPMLLQNKSCVRAADIDGDGDVDFFVGGRVVPFNYGKPASSFILINDGHGKFTDQTKSINNEFSTLGMITDAQWGDIDKDGDPDLIVVGEWMPVRVFLNEKGTLTEKKDVVSNLSTIKNMIGLWQCISLVDVDKDGDLDMIAGNLGLNSSLNGNDKTELRLYTGVLNDDGKKVPLLTRMEKDGRYYPVSGWLELSKQMPERFLKAYPTAAKYTGVDMDELISTLKLKWDAVVEVNQLASLYFENKDGKEFIVRQLPDEMQYTKTYTINTDDLNGDGYADLFLGGNDWNVSPNQGAYAAGIGQVAVGDQKGFFRTVPLRESGVNLRSEIRSIKAIQVKGKQALLVACNNDSLKLFELRKQPYVAK